MNRELREQIGASIKNFRLPRYHEIPDIGLYLEQTSKYVAECLAPLTSENMTGSMISNYVKRGVLSNPIKKQYSREQIARLICIATVKNVLAMEDIKLMFRLQESICDVQTAYNEFCSEFENALMQVFGFTNVSTDSQENTDYSSTMLHRVIAACAHTLYLKRMFSSLHAQENH